MNMVIPDLHSQNLLASKDPLVISYKVEISGATLHLRIIFISQYLITDRQSLAISRAILLTSILDEVIVFNISKGSNNWFSFLILPIYSVLIKGPACEHEQHLVVR